MTVGDPLLFLLNGEAGKELRAPVRARWYVDDAAENVSNLEAQQTKGHVGEALALFGEVGHVGVQIGVVDVEGLVGVMYLAGAISN